MNASVTTSVVKAAISNAWPKIVATSNSVVRRATAMVVLVMVVPETVDRVMVGLAVAMWLVTIPVTATVLAIATVPETAGPIATVGQAMCRPTIVVLADSACPNRATLRPGRKFPAVTSPAATMAPAVSKTIAAPRQAPGPTVRRVTTVARVAPAIPATRQDRMSVDRVRIDPAAPKWLAPKSHHVLVLASAQRNQTSARRA